MKVIQLKSTADGFCGACEKQVPPESLNRFYCSEECCWRAQRQLMPELFKTEDEQQSST